MTMTPEEFKAKYLNQGAPPAPPPAVPAYQPPAAPVYQQPAATVGFVPQPQPKAAAPKAWGGKSKFPQSTTLPLVCRQSKKDGRFYVSWNMSGKIELDQEAFNYVTSTGQGLGEIEVGKLTVWPPFEKKTP